MKKEGTFAPLAVQEAVARRVVEVLSRKHKCCPMIIDPNEARRLAIIFEVIRQMATGEVEGYSQQQVISLDFEALFFQVSEETPMRQQLRALVLQQWKQRHQIVHSELDNEDQQQSPPQLELWVDQAVVVERLKSMITTIRQAEGRYILFVNHFHRFALYSRDEYSVVDAVHLFVPVLARRQIALIGACSLEEYRQYIERDAFYQRRFQEIIPPEASQEYWPEEGLPVSKE